MSTRNPPLKRTPLIPLGMLSLTIAGTVSAVSAHNALTPRTYAAPRATQTPVLDGALDDPSWQLAAWDSLTFQWAPAPGAAFDSNDCFAWFKAVWSQTTNRLYVAVKVRDDLYHPGKKCAEYFSQECVEIFLDPDHSGGYYRGSGDAFCYHVLSDGSAINPFWVPYGSTNWKDVNLRNHVTLGLSKDSTIWEMSFILYSRYRIDQDSTVKIMQTGDTIGFSVAYNDEDNNDCKRDHMIGWVKVEQDDSWQNADRFGNMVLVNEPVSATVPKSGSSPFPQKTVNVSGLSGRGGYALSGKRLMDLRGRSVRLYTTGSKPSGNALAAPR